MGISNNALTTSVTLLPLAADCCGYDTAIAIFVLQTATENLRYPGIVGAIPILRVYEF